MDKGMDLDLQGDRVQIAMNNFDGLVENDRVKGKLNGGGIPVRIHTSGGRVKINQM
jgi:autotransporter translocation and assembly factor TamB